MKSIESIEQLSEGQQQKLRNINIQFKFLEHLRRERLNTDALIQFAEKQKYGKETDEYKQIMQVYVGDSMDPRLQSKCRMPEFPTWKESDFNECDANTYKDYVICSGPDSEDSVRSFLENVCMHTSNTKRRLVDTIVIFGTPDENFEGRSEDKNYYNYLLNNKKYGRYKVETRLLDDHTTDEVNHYQLIVTYVPGNSTPSWLKKFDVYQFNTKNRDNLLNLSPKSKNLLISIAHKKAECVALQDGSGFSCAASILFTFRILRKFYEITSGSSERIQENLVKELRNFRTKRPGVLSSKELFIQAINLAFELQEIYLRNKREIILSMKSRSLESSDEDSDGLKSASSSSGPFSGSPSATTSGPSSGSSSATTSGPSSVSSSPPISLPIQIPALSIHGNNSSELPTPPLSKSPPTPPFVRSPREDHKIHTVGIIFTCDTKDKPAAELRQFFIHQGNIAVYMINIGVKPVEHRLFPIDVDTSELLLEDAPDSTSLQKINRPAAMAHIKRGIERKIVKIHEQFPLDAVVAFGGTTGSEIGAAAMRQLPNSICKVLITTAPENYRKDTDIYCIKPKLDIGNVLNEDLIRSIRDAVKYVTGSFNVVEKNSPKITQEVNQKKKPTLAITQFGTSTALVQRVSDHYSEEGYDIKAYHAKGEGGGKVMEDDIRAGTVDVVCDVTLPEVVAEIVHSPWRAGINRMSAAATMGIPTVIVPGCIDMFIVDEVSLTTSCYKGRLIRKCTEDITVVRTNLAEYKQVASHIAGMIKLATAPVIILIPKKGFSAFDSESDDWKGDNKEKNCWYKDFRFDDILFIGFLREHINRLKLERKESGREYPPIELREFNYNINAPEFAAEVIKATQAVIELHKPAEQEKQKLISKKTGTTRPQSLNFSQLLMLNQRRGPSSSSIPSAYPAPSSSTKEPIAIALSSSTKEPIAIALSGSTKEPIARAPSGSPSEPIARGRSNSLNSSK